MQSHVAPKTPPEALYTKMSLSWLLESFMGFVGLFLGFEKYFSNKIPAIWTGLILSRESSTTGFLICEYSIFNKRMFFYYM